MKRPVSVPTLSRSNSRLGFDCQTIPSAERSAEISTCHACWFPGPRYGVLIKTGFCAQTIEPMGLVETTKLSIQRA